jgi:hypothetical protein
VTLWRRRRDEPASLQRGPRQSTSGARTLDAFDNLAAGPPARKMALQIHMLRHMTTDARHRHMAPHVRAYCRSAGAAGGPHDKGTDAKRHKRPIKTLHNHYRWLRSPAGRYDITHGSACSKIAASQALRSVRSDNESSRNREETTLFTCGHTAYAVALCYASARGRRGSGTPAMTYATATGQV